MLTLAQFRTHFLALMKLLSLFLTGQKNFLLDLKEAYYSLPVHLDSRKYAAIIAHHLVFIPHRTTFGLMNAPMRFKSMMEDNMTPCTRFVCLFIRPTYFQ